MMGYEITSIEDNWIFIKHDYRDELDGFIMLMKSIEGELSGRIIQMDGEDIQYTINDFAADLFGHSMTWYGIAIRVAIIAVMILVRDAG